MIRAELTNAQWEQLQPLLPPQKPLTGRPNKDHRTIINGILWILRTGAPWRDLPEQYGSWKTISSRFYRWRIVYGALVLGVAGLAAAAGLWMLKRWGLWLAVVVSAINLVSAAPGVPFAPNAALQAAAAATVVASALLVVLVVLPSSRRAFVAT